MASIRDDMVGGLTTMLAEQAEAPGRLTVDVVTFDDEIETQQTQKYGWGFVFLGANQDAVLT